jgi:hypothetical protein
MRMPRRPISKRKYNWSRYLCECGAIVPRKQYKDVKGFYHLKKHIDASRVSIGNPKWCTYPDKIIKVKHIILKKKNTKIT